ncbi:MAG: sigma-70 family RNA polymerase sigma factor [Clostridium sp.]|nr:sigma-70 family RNA polymerase sigma factor [Clostridium sp.]
MVKGIENNALTIIYEKYSKRLYLYLLSLCHNQQLAEDLMQETFIKAFMSLDEVSDGIVQWLYKVAKNLFIDTLRKNKNIISEDEFDVKTISDKTDILKELIAKERNRRLYYVIQQLPIKERELITLYYFGELKQEDIAQQMSLTHGAVRTSLFRIKKKLLKIMEEE